MYTIKRAASLAGISVALMRAWERRYGVVAPARSPSGYRLYDDTAIARLQAMRLLVDDGWSPSNAATAIREADAHGLPLPRASQPGDSRGQDGQATDRADASSQASRRWTIARDPDVLIERFVGAASALDGARLEAVLDEMFTRGSFESAAADYVLPALRALGAAWASGSLDVAAEHAASTAVLRRLAASYQAAGRPGRGAPVLVGLPPGCRHELGALAFSVVARRAGIPVLYLGPDLPTANWVRAAAETRAIAVVIGVVRSSDVRAADAVAEGLHTALPDLIVASGGTCAREPREEDRSWRVRLPPDDLVAAVEQLASTLGRGHPIGDRQPSGGPA